MIVTTPPATPPFQSSLSSFAFPPCHWGFLCIITLLVTKMILPPPCAWSRPCPVLFPWPGSSAELSHPSDAGSLGLQSSVAPAHHSKLQSLQWVYWSFYLGVSVTRCHVPRKSFPNLPTLHANLFTPLSP